MSSSSITTVSTLSASSPETPFSGASGSGPFVNPISSTVVAMTTSSSGSEGLGNNNRNISTTARRSSSPALYEIRRRHSGEVCYLFVPDEYELIKSHVMKAAREELDFLRNTINILAERLKLLEVENRVFKRYAQPETLALVDNHMKTNYKKGQFQLNNQNDPALWGQITFKKDFVGDGNGPLPIEPAPPAAIMQTPEFVLSSSVPESPVS